MKEKKNCQFCGCELTEENSRHFDGVDMCKDCFENETTTCCECHDTIWTDNANYPDDDDMPYCNTCFDELSDDEDGVIEDYSYKPEPIFYGSGSLYMGVELEIDKGGECSSKAEKLLNIANAYDDVLYAKYDGSISCGFELVSHPMTLDYHINNMKWQEIFSEAINMGYRSHNTSTCGLHIHVNRSAFGKTFEEQETVIARVVHFVELHWNELVKFSRRTEENLNRWAARYCTISEKVQDTYKKAKDKRLGRYVAVNLEPQNTIECRMFKGSLRYKTFIATLQLVDEICRLATALSDKEIEKMAWNSFAAQISSDKPELIEYLKSKQLYVNEKTEDTEEM